jgi:hypothetical protein
MHSTRIWIMASATGALIGAASMYYALDSESHALACNGNDQQSASLAGMGRTDEMARDGRMGISATAVNDQMMQSSISERSDLHPPPHTNTGVPVASPGTGGIGKPAAVDEEGTIQIITARLRDPVYLYSATLPDLMQSEEMLKLSDQSRERVVQEVMGMINRGEIDARTFMASKK